MRAAPIRDFEQSLPMELLKARESAMARFRPMLRDHGLTEQQWRVIRALAAFDKIDASELARRSFLLAPSLTRILQYLEGENIVTRSSDANDQRRAVFALTVRGRKVFELVGPDSEVLYAEIEQAFGKKKLGLLYDLLAEFSHVLSTTSEETSARPANRVSQKKAANR
ncbi:MAG: homoprotocatechuate degradation operon regulator HpaR [Proteobacteria bacterium]|nr:homoprotocatechuate degradation operon regulator HpaR [Pseudomonadota bacterium]MDA0994762.1 homoprotocatechuate degradation operon regulator HpaR [Pseudomonadota bacterium]